MARTIEDLDEGMDENVEKAWLEEVERRYKKLENGEVELIPAEEVFSRAKARLSK